MLPILSIGCLAHTAQFVEPLLGFTTSWTYVPFNKLVGAMLEDVNQRTFLYDGYIFVGEWESIYIDE